MSAPVGALCPNCYMPSMAMPVDSIERGHLVSVFTCTQGHVIVGLRDEIADLLLSSDEGSVLMEILEHHQVVPGSLEREDLLKMIAIAREGAKAKADAEFRAMVADLEAELDSND